jgi:hypothetical protein
MEGSNTMSQLKKIDALIRGIGQRSVSFRNAVQTAAVLVVEHAKDSNDCSRALSLVAAVGMASDRVKLIQWFGLVSPINVTFTSDVTKRRVGLRKSDSKAYNAFNIDKAKSLNYWEVGKSDDDMTEELTSGAVNTLILKLVKKLRREMDEGHVAANDKDAVEAKITALQSAVNAVAA